MVRQLLNLVPFRITKLEIEHRQEISGDDILLELGEAHSQTRMAAGAPADERVVRLLVFGLGALEARGVPGIRVVEEGGVEVVLADVVCHCSRINTPIPERREG